MTPTLLIPITLIITAIPLTVYLIYILAIILTKEPSPKPLKTSPEITVIIPTYNESEVIEHRIKNLKDINYPTENIHAIIVDDQSTDNTTELAKKAFIQYNISGEVIVKSERTGTNASVNLGISKATTDIIVTTDADVVFEHNALNHALSTLLSNDKIGAVCGELEPVVMENSFTTRSEQAYRSVYGKMCTWESNIYSTYCFNGPLIMLKKEAFLPIPETHGASDAGMALRIIRNGYRCIYEPSAKFYEYITEDLKQQRRQKLRRSARLLEATIYNIGLISPKFGRFGLFIFPMRILMFFVAPAAFFLSVILWSYLLGQVNIIYGLMIWIGLIIAVLSGHLRSNLISSFIWHQLYLFFSLFYMFKGMHMWKAVDREKV